MSQSEYILVRRVDHVDDPSAAFIDEEAARINREYQIFSDDERHELHQLYAEHIAAGDGENGVRDLIINQIRCIHEIYLQAKEIMDYAAKKGINIPLNIDMDSVDHSTEETDQGEGSE
ncbi:hypothetical protein C8R46DRAFT_1222283 [Mycena filopes]|nr:hypothetical protein C8R46DRAFT_1222283 [Mycena filopes]